MRKSTKSPLKPRPNKNLKKLWKGGPRNPFNKTHKSMTDKILFKIYTLFTIVLN